jgi:3-hydroxybutyryl-CoA dehydratase|tara:strand:+ start:38 stop:451 length:414 start_codon:yes stop_codon:yes gene_type:complete
MKYLNTIQKLIDKKDISLYADVSGDRNPIHLDDEFAANSYFSGVVAHGMLTLAFVSEMLVGTFGINWFETGSLKIRFKKPAYPGDRVHTEGEILNIKPGSCGDLVTCSVSLVDSDTGEAIITGKASVTIRKDKSQNG